MRREGFNRREGEIRGGDLGRLPQQGAAEDPIADLRSIAAITSGSVFVPGEYYATAPTGRTLGMVDVLDPTHLLWQPAVEYQAEAPVVITEANGRKGLRLSGFEWYESSRAASAWAYLHSGVGAEWIIGFVQRSTRTTGVRRALLSTKSYTGAGTGTGILHSLYDQSGATNERTELIVSNGAANIISTVTTASTANLDLNVPSYSDFRYKNDGNAVEYQKWIKGTSEAATSDGGLVPSATTPMKTLRLGVYGEDTYLSNPATIDVLFIIITGSGYVLDTTERTAVRTWIQSRWGIAP